MESESRKPRGVSAAVLVAAVAVALMPAGCLQWPGAPFMDSVAALPEGVDDQLQAAFPGATLTGPVYRMHMEDRGGSYRVVSRRFLFRDAAGDLHRGEFDGEGALSVSQVTVAGELPEELRASFFEGPSAMVPGGEPSGRVWRYTEPSTQEATYEFEFEAGGRPGLGAISESGNRSSAHFFVGTGE